MNHRTTFGFSPAWWARHDAASAKRARKTHAASGTLLATLLTALIWP